MQSTFEKYLQIKHYSKNTIQRYGILVNHYLEWCEKNHIQSDQATIEELYAYKSECVGQGLELSTVQQKLSVLKHYFQAIGRLDNPALQIKHKKRENSLPEYLLNESELRTIYTKTIAKNMIQKRDKVMLSFVVFQGLRDQELSQLELEDLNIEEASVYIASTLKSNARTLELHPLQITRLLPYLYELRPKLLEEAKKNTTKLFFSMGRSNYPLGNVIHRTLKRLKKEHPKLKTFTQLRESRMSIWVKDCGIRKAQYLSGLRYVSSMLRYKTANVDKLKLKLNIAHPMEKMKF